MLKFNQKFPVCSCITSGQSDMEHIPFLWIIFRICSEKHAVKQVYTLGPIGIRSL